MSARCWLARVGLLLSACAGCAEEAPPPYALHRDDDDAGRAERPRTDPDPEPEPEPTGPPRAGSSGGGESGSAASPGTTDAGEPGPAPGGCEGGPTLRVLFIGNSHTFTNDLPSLVRELACAAGTQVISQSSTPPGVGFIEHAMDANTAAAIAADAWDFVVMQDQSQRPGFRLPGVEADHLPSLVSLVDAIEQHRAETRPLMFMVWAHAAGDADNCAYYPLICDFEGHTRALAQGYRLYAERTGSIVAPVALAWAAVRADPEAPLPAAELWNPDGYHPMPPGSYLAAAVIVGTMLESTTRELTFEGGHSPEVAAYLREVADQVVRDERTDPHVITEERVRIQCLYGPTCSAAADATAVTFTLSTDDCDALVAGDAEVRARIHTTLSCRDGACVTVALGAWHELATATIEDGGYQIHAHVDLDGDGQLGDGDLEACETGFELGGGADLLFGELSPR